MLLGHGEDWMGRKKTRNSERRKKQLKKKSPLVKNSCFKAFIVSVYLMKITWQCLWIPVFSEFQSPNSHKNVTDEVQCYVFCSFFLALRNIKKCWFWGHVHICIPEFYLVTISLMSFHWNEFQLECVKWCLIKICENSSHHDYITLCIIKLP